MGALSAPLTYGLARELLDERGARVAGLLLALSPGALMFGVTTRRTRSTARSACSPRGRSPRRSWRSRLLGAVLLAVASLFAWSLLAVGAWAAVLAWRRHGLRSAIELSAICGVVLLALHGAFSALTGFDPIGTLRATEEVYRPASPRCARTGTGCSARRSAFLLVLGLPISWLALRALARGTPEAVAIFAVLAFAAVMGFTKAETERIWLFFAPFVCLAAARALRAPAGARAASRPRSPRRRCFTSSCWTPSGERQPVAASHGVGGSVPSTRRRSAPSTSTFQIGASALTRSISARAPSNASPRCGAEAATTTLGSDSGTVPTRCSSATAQQAVAAGLLLPDRTQLLERHLGVGLVVELGHVARDALEDHDGAGARIADRGRDRADVERLLRHAHAAHRSGAAAHGRDQRDLVLRAHRLAGARVLAVDRHDALARAQLADRRLRHRGQQVLDDGAVGQLDLDVLAARPLTQAGEQPDGDLHGSRG